MKKLLTLFVFLFIPLIAILFVQCNEPVIEPTDQDMVLSLNKGGEGGGDHTSELPNNLSFPALLADGFTLDPVTESLTVPYADPYSGYTMAEIFDLYKIDNEDLPDDEILALIDADAVLLYPGLTAEEIALLRPNGPWHAQKVVGNAWRGPFETYTVGTPVAFIDWGDMMESVDAKVRTPYRVEFGVYVELPAPVSAYTMTLLAFPSSLDETQGTNGTRYDCNYATIASPTGTLVIQMYDEDATLTWNAATGQWDGAYPPEDVKFAQECNVGGKFIFGASVGGWKPAKEGKYRITFYLKGSDVSLVGAEVGDYNDGAPIIPKIGERNTAEVDDINNLTYMDVTAIDGGRSGSESGGEDGDGDGDGDGGDHEGDGNNGTGGE